MEQSLKLDLPVVLPDVPDERDQCVARLQERLAGVRGILKTHIDPRDGQPALCLHFDPNLVSLEQVERLAQQAGVEIHARYRHESFKIVDMDCADCALTIQHVLERREGIVRAAVSYPLERLEVEYDSQLVCSADIQQLVRAIGYDVAKKDAEESGLEQVLDLALPIVCGLFLAIGYFGLEAHFLPDWAAWLCYGIAYLTGGWELAQHGVRAALRGRFDIEFLMLVAALGAAAVGEPAEGGLLLFLFSLGHALEHFATERARAAVEALGSLTPKTARVRRDAGEKEVPVEDLHPGELVIVRPGERLPADGTIREGRSAIDQSPITGESVPVDKEPGNDVFAGSLNGSGGLVVEVTKAAADSTMARVMKMVEEAQTQRSPTQRFSEAFTRVFVPVTLMLVVAMIVMPPVIGWLSWADAFLRAMAVLVGASPCALALATPAAVLSGIARAARSGVLIKGGMHLENLGTLRAIAFDKTGTLTVGRPEVTEIVTHDGVGERELLRLAAAVESRASHPLARAVVRRAEQDKIELPAADELEALSGRGVCACVDKIPVRIGTAALFEEAGLKVPETLTARVAELEGNARTTMIVAYGERFLGVLGLADRPREEARAALAELRRIGIADLIMLTGDNQRVAESVARAVGITEARGGLLPEDKLAAIKEIKARHGQVAMIGDGVNDAPALALATVGIAMGAGGTDVALESADVALMADDLGKLPFALELSQQSRAVIRQNLLVSLGVVVLLVPAALFGLAGIGYAIIFHEGSTLLVVANALRLLGFREREGMND
ncbi:MAG: heavy metal translocating P-type ATPase [Gemmataceae bacterium]